MNKLLNLIFIFFLFPTTWAFAQGAVSLSVTPTLFEMSANPEQEWKSSIKVINVNDFDLTVYASVVNFAPKGEGGDGLFIPVFEEQTEGSTLAEWIDISAEPIVIPKQQTVAVPFTVNVPENADPGGHFAAILIGTKPPSVEGKTPSVQTSQMVTSLFFVRIAGDVVEAGSIREFRTVKSFLTKPEATFELRFENKGNVHIQPQGDIRIFNMWGEERGVIPINRQSHFGNVLPNSVRKFSFSWSGEWALADIGRYSAQVTLGYGIDGRKFVSQKTYFWVVPIKQLTIILLGLFLFIALVVWLIRLYVRRMLVVAGFDPNEHKKQVKQATVYKTEDYPKFTPSVTAPIKAGILDLRAKLKDSESKHSKIKTLLFAIFDYWKFILAIIMLAVFIAGVFWYVTNANIENRSYEVTYLNSEQNTKISSEEIIYNELSSQQNKNDIAVNDTLPPLNIVNQSGVPGLAAKLRAKLELMSYQVLSINSDTENLKTETKIVYSKENKSDAEELSNILNNAEIQIDDNDENDNTITIYIGSDLNLD